MGLAYLDFIGTDLLKKSYSQRRQWNKCWAVALFFVLYIFVGTTRNYVYLPLITSHKLPLKTIVILQLENSYRSVLSSDMGHNNICDEKRFINRLWCIIWFHALLAKERKTWQTESLKNGTNYKKELFWNPSSAIRRTGSIFKVFKLAFDFLHFTDNLVN